MIMRDKVVRWWNGEIKIRIRILEISIGRGDTRGQCYKLCFGNQGIDIDS